VLSGNVDIREVNLSFRVGGRLQQVLVDEGATVKAGQILARLDDAPQRNAWPMPKRHSLHSRPGNR
jgi:HlyD family secretion protein